MTSRPQENILILNFTRMGDLIQSSPMISGLKAQFPNSKITLVVGRDFLEFSKRLEGVDQWIAFDLKQFNENEELKNASWIPVYRYLKEFLQSLSRMNFTRAYNLSHSKLSALMLSYLEIPHVHGFVCDAEGNRMTEHPWLQYFFTEPFNRQLNTFNLVDIFMRGGGVNPTGEGVHIKTFPEDHLKALEVFPEKSGQPVIGIQAGSSLEGRRWPAGHFSRLADMLAETLKAKILLFGVQSESKVAEEIVSGMTHKSNVTNLVGKTGIDSLVGLVQRCHYLVTNDTGTMHIAAALKVPIVGLFFAHAHAHETGPYSEGNLIFEANLSCAPCSYGVECNNIVCVQAIRPELVFEMLRGHQEQQEWTLPEHETSLDRVRIFKTEMDSDKAIRMKNLVKHPLTLFDFLAWCYRKLWIQSLGTEGECHSKEVPSSFILSSFDCRDSGNWTGEVQKTWARLQNLKKMARTGLDYSREISRNLDSQSKGTQNLSLLAENISSLDEKINLLGMTNLEIKPLTDMFNKRKENIGGTQLEEMNRQTANCYQKLADETTGLLDIVNTEWGLVSGQAAFGEEGAEAPINMDVPGRKELISESFSSFR